MSTLTLARRLFMKYLKPLLGVIAMMLYSAKSGRKTSQNGIDFIRRVEGEKLTVYTDSAGYKTIGVGHKLKAGENYNIITPEKSMQLLRADLKVTESAINSFVSVPLNQQQFDALSSFIFNVGVGAFKESTLLKKLNAYDYNGVIEELPRWNKITVNGVKKVSGGLSNRRTQEQQLFIA